MSQFLTLTLIIGLMIISPGADFAIVVKNSLSYGRLSGFYAALGIAVANLCHVTINLLGIGVVIAESTTLFAIMKNVGALYLMYLGYKGLRAKPAVRQEVQTIPPQSKGFYSGFITSLLNPKCWLFFLSFFSVLLSPETKILTQVFYGLWIGCLALIWFSLVAWFLTNPLISQRIESFKHWLERITGGILLLLGIKLFSHEIA